MNTYEANMNIREPSFYSKKWEPKQNMRNDFGEKIVRNGNTEYDLTTCDVRNADIMKR